MPAVTADLLTLPRLSSVSPASEARPARGIVTAIRTFEGEGFPV